MSLANRPSSTENLEKSGSGAHKDVFDRGYEVWKEAKNFSLEEAERDLGKFSVLKQFGLVSTPATTIEESGDDFYIRQEKADWELPELGEFYDGELLFDRALNWMDQAARNGVLYTDAKPENFSVFNGEVMPHDLTGGGWVEHEYGLEDVQSTYETMIDNFSSVYDTARGRLEEIAESRSRYFGNL